MRKDDQIIGVKVTQISDNKCKEENGNTINLSFSYTVLCDEEVTENGGAVFQSLNLDDECAPEVTYTHAAGCHKVKVIEGTHTKETIILTEVELQPL